MTNQSSTSPSTPPADVEESLTLKDLGLGKLFWAARDAVIVGGGPENRILFWNPAAEDLYGYTAEEAVGHPFDLLVPNEIRNRVTSLVDAFASADDGGLRALGEPIELPAMHKSGEQIFVEFSVGPLQVGEDLYGFALIRDCTKRKRIEAERDALLATAQETLRQTQELAALKADFTAMIAHEVGSPLAAVCALIDLLDRDDLPPSKRTEILATMRSETHLLQRLVDDVQSATSMDRGDFSVHLQPTPVETLLNEAAASASVLLAGHDFLVVPPPHTRVLADRERIGQVLRNLLGNAAKYTPAGTPVTLQATHEDGRTRIEVIDRGPGIAAEDLRHIFSKFGRGRDATGKRLPGMGLGLFLSRRIIHEHGSELVAASVQGQGATFSFELEEVS